jgi:5-methyltetrahydrofolate--homocysteine methyltransferase
MQRTGCDIPLLIGGATTSKAHTALKIEPAYSNGSVTYVTDASRGVGTASKLLSEQTRAAFESATRADYAKVRERIKKRRRNINVMPYPEARNAAPAIEPWVPPTPRAPGVTEVLDISLAELVPFIDWTPFFMTWELAGKYPKILDDAVVGESASALFADAQEMLARIVKERWLGAAGCVGLWPANRLGSDDIEIFTDDTRQERLAVLHHLRQQAKKGAAGPHYCLADFVAAAPCADYIGGFAVTAGLGIEAALKKFDGDDYSEIMLKALADRLAEACAEYLHRLVRTELWGYSTDTGLNNDELIKERYQGIRPAPGYPACPDHTEKATLFKLLTAGNAGLELTESFAMLPAASVAGWYFAHPEARYFGVGKIGQDQLDNYARRKGWQAAEARRWLRPNLAE